MVSSIYNSNQILFKSDSRKGVSIKNINKQIEIQINAEYKRNKKLVFNKPISAISSKTKNLFTKKQRELIRNLYYNNDITKWETDFLLSVYKQTSYSDKQKVILNKIALKYKK
jgi:hypothetical protein